MHPQHDTIAAPFAKVATAWAIVGITSWAEFASFLAAVYSALLIAEWLWKRIVRPSLVRHGWVQP